MQEPLRVLLAVASPADREVAMLWLQGMGLSVDVTADGQATLAALRRCPYDVIVIDLQLPGLDVLEGARRLRQQGTDDRSPYVVALMAPGQLADPAGCLAAGIDELIPRPCDSQTVSQAMERAAARLKGADVPQPAVDPSALDGMCAWLAPEDIPSLAELVQDFLADTRTRLPQLQTALVDRDTDTLFRLAHTLKATSGMYGARRLAALCLELETGGREKRLENLDARLDELRAEFIRVEADLSAAVRRLQTR